MDQYCMEPDYLQWSLELSLKNLGVEGVDLFYLHNPEMALGYLSYDELMEKVFRAFERFEALRKAGKFRYYGVATWNALTFEPTHMEYISLADLVAQAERAGGAEHGLKFVQMPFNLGKPHASSYSNQKIGELYHTPFQAAKKLGLHVVVSSSLLQAKLFQRPFSQQIREILGAGLVSDVQCALQFSRSAPEVTTALFGSKEPDHVRHNLEVLRRPTLPPETFAKIFQL